MKETLISKVLSSILITNSMYSIEDIVLDVRHLWVYRFVISSSSIISSPFPYFHNGKVYVRVRDTPNFHNGGPTLTKRLRRLWISTRNNHGTRQTK